MPGRLIGVSQDVTGLKAYRLSLQTREQHIRREKATSNICTAQALLAIMAGFYALWHGPKGLMRIASKIHSITKYFAKSAIKNGYKIKHKNFFDTIVIETGNNTDKLVASALKENINVRNMGDSISISYDELSDQELLDSLIKAFNLKNTGFLEQEHTIDRSIKRKSVFLKHPIFSSFTSETEMMRYIRQLSDKDLALDRTMIPLGSCTMKLNAATEMIPITWPEFSSIHPFAPENQTKG